MLLLSIFAMILMEIVASILSLRGKHLMRGIKRMLASDKEIETFEEFKNHARFQQLTARFLSATRPPSYLHSTTFASILWNILAKDTSVSVQTEISKLKDKNLQQILHQLFDQTDIQKVEFEQKVSAWYNEIMERVTGWYKRNIQAILIGIGLLLSIGFNVDIFAIFDKYNGQVVALLNDNLNTIKVLPTWGWDGTSIPDSFTAWLLKILGWIITALCISLGASFCFDVLKKIVMIKNTGGLSIDLPVVVAKPSNPASGIKLRTIHTDVNEPELATLNYINKPVG